MRTADFVAFSSGPIDGLYQLLLQEPTEVVFKRLASLVVENDFTLPAFLVVRTGSFPAAFVYGDADLICSGASTTITGSSSSTWIERPLENEEALRFHVGSISDDDRVAIDTRLVLGCVPAAGLSFGIPEEKPSPEDAEPEVDPIWQPPEPEVLSDPHELEIDVDPDWDPRADPEPIDLAVIGSSPTVSPEHPATPEISDHLIAEPQVEPDQPPIQATEPARFDNKSILETTRPAEPSSGGMFPSTLPRETDAQPLLIPEPARQNPTQGRLAFDDGQITNIVVGAYVGRFPVKNGLPEGYEGVVVRSEHVSRTHWEVFTDSGIAYVRDLGSHNGTSLQGPDDQEAQSLQAHEPTELLPDSVIHFGDRWARYER